MQIDIPAHIEKLLFLHDALVIPGFGGFTATRTPASTDYVGGTVNPPAKALAFSENLTVDDGLLTADIADTHRVSTEDAQRAVEEFVEKMRALLDQREIVTLPGVGRLYKNYVQKIQFLPDATNFNASSYGLPPLQFSPIARSREVEKASEPQPVSSATATSSSSSAPLPPQPPMPEPTFAPERIGGESKVGTALGIFLLLAALSAGIWYWQYRKKAVNEVQAPQTVQTDQAPANPETPKEESIPSATPPPKEETGTDEDPDKAAAESLEAREEAARAKVNALRNGRECILIIATLSDKGNVDKLRAMLKEEGYDEYYVPKGNSYMVGVRFYYLKPAEIEEKRKALMAITGVNYIAVKKK